jgi:hypothetical protein
MVLMGLDKRGMSVEQIAEVLLVEDWRVVEEYDNFSKED